MIRILNADDRQRVPDLFEQMFVDRAAVFHNKLRWNVYVRNGKEIDHLDYSGQSIYVVHVDEKDRVTGSLRILPSNGDILLKSSYADQFRLDPALFHPDIWECSRFYVNPGAARRMQTTVSALLLAGLCEYSLTHDIKGILGFFDRPMMRVYQKLGWVPTTIAQSCDRAKTFVGKWDVTTDALGKLRRGLGK